MKDFLFLFRSTEAATNRSPEEMQASTQKWMEWITRIAAQNKLIDRGNRLASDGVVVRPNNVVTDGPYTEIKELIGGYTLIKAASIEEAAEIAKGCPILLFGGNVEVREISAL